MNDKELIGTVRLVRSPITYRFERATILEIQKYSPGRGLLVQFDDDSHRSCFKSIGPNGVKLGVVWLMQATIDNDTLAIPS